MSQGQSRVGPCHLLPVEALHGCEGGALAGVQLVARGEGGGQAQQEAQQRRHGGDRGEMECLQSPSRSPTEPRSSALIGPWSPDGCSCPPIGPLLPSSAGLFSEDPDPESSPRFISNFLPQLLL